MMKFFTVLLPNSLFIITSPLWIFPVLVFIIITDPNARNDVIYNPFYERSHRG